jgi:hypothetical protein
MTMIIDGTNGLTFNNSTTQASAGVVLQVINATYSTAASRSSSAYADTGLTATITPKFVTSKVLVICNIAGCAKANATYLTLQLVRNSSTSLSVFEAQGGFTSSSATNSFGSSSVTYLDSPASISATTYKVQFASVSNVAEVYVQASNSASTITLMEIAA